MEFDLLPYDIIFISIIVVAILFCLFVIFVFSNDNKIKENKDYMEYINSQFKDLEIHNKNDKKLVWNKRFNRDKKLLFWGGFFVSIFLSNIYVYIYF